MSAPIEYTPKIEPGIQLTQAAEHRVVSYLQTHQHQSLRLSVKKTGCSGLAYVLDYVQTVQPDDVIFPLSSGYSICIDKTSYPYLKGLTMDYVKQGLNAKFTFQNPNQTGQCGCGESFSVQEIQE